MVQKWTAAHIVSEKIWFGEQWKNPVLGKSDNGRHGPIYLSI
jgi:hypothetical protein